MRNVESYYATTLGAINHQNLQIIGKTKSHFNILNLFLLGLELQIYSLSLSLNHSMAGYISYIIPHHHHDVWNCGELSKIFGL